MLIDPFDVPWRVELEGRSWGDEGMERYSLTPEKLEMCDGKVCCSEEDRLRLLGLLLEGCGAGVAVRFGDPSVWREAVAKLDDREKNFLFAMNTAHRQWDNIVMDGDSEYWKRYYAQWAMPNFVEVGPDGIQRDVTGLSLMASPEYDWNHWVSYRTSGDSWEHVRNATIVHATRFCILRSQNTKTATREQWREQWVEKADNSGWLLADRIFLTSEPTELPDSIFRY